MTIKQAILYLQKHLNIHFSSEQLKVLKYNLHTTTLVDSCAGSGKTLLLICIILMKILTQQNKSTNILGITFSRDGARNMSKRFAQYTQQFQTPSFLTFHALFYHLLKIVTPQKNISVIPSYTDIYTYLEKHIVKQPKLISNNQLLQNIFATRSTLINNGYTYNGVTLNPYANYQEIREGTKVPKLIFNLQKPQNDTDAMFIANYKPIIEAYLRYKQQHQLIDFGDMMSKIWEIIQQHNQQYKQIKNIMNKYSLVCIDEFQDISLVQWKIIQAICSPTAKQHMLMIGDDDQSIYSFRGSNPKIILTLKQKMPQLHIFTLSTNYRTAGNILDTVKPLITSNHVRLPKKLKSYNHNGIIREYISNDKNHTANSAMLRHLLNQLYDPKISNNEIAVLMHFNNSRMILLDWLANHHYYIHTSQHYLLQNNLIYKTVFNIIKGLLSNKMELIYHSSIQIGFRKYYYHIKNLLKILPKRCSITNYVNQALISNQGQSSHVTHLDKILDNYNKKVRNNSPYYKHQYGKLMWKAVIDLTAGHTKFLEQNKMLNADRYQEVMNYLKKQIISQRTKTNIRKYIKLQIQKSNYYQEDNKTSQLNIMSIHQSKGLEFQYVYLYDMSSQIDTEKDILINKLFSPIMTLLQFYRFLLQTPLKNLRKIEYLLYKDTQPHAFVKVARKMHILIDMNLTSSSKMFVRILHMKFNKSKAEAGVEEQLWQMYHNVTHESKEIEEERRLIYVGATRAKKELDIAYNRNADPLLNEMKINLQDRYYLEPTGQILDNKNNKKFLQKIQKLN